MPWDREYPRDVTSGLPTVFEPFVMPPPILDIRRQSVQRPVSVSTTAAVKGEDVTTFPHRIRPNRREVIDDNTTAKIFASQQEGPSIALEDRTGAETRNSREHRPPTNEEDPDDEERPEVRGRYMKVVSNVTGFVKKVLGKMKQTLRRGKERKEGKKKDLD